jgi:hypothetical protein
MMRVWGRDLKGGDTLGDNTCATCVEFVHAQAAAFDVDDVVGEGAEEI